MISKLDLGSHAKGDDETRVAPFKIVCLILDTENYFETDQIDVASMSM
jgi:hypothetical protein